MTDEFELDDVALVTVDQAAAELQVPASTIRSWQRRYGMRSHRSGGRVYLSLGELWDVEQRTRQTPRGRAARARPHHP